MDVSIITIFVLCDEHLLYTTQLELNITKMLALPSSISVSLTINKEYVELIQFLLCDLCGKTISRARARSKYTPPIKDIVLCFK